MRSFNYFPDDENRNRLYDSEFQSVPLHPPDLYRLRAGNFSFPWLDCNRKREAEFEIILFSRGIAPHHLPDSGDAVCRIIIRLEADSRPRPYFPGAFYPETAAADVNGPYSELADPAGSAVFLPDIQG